MNQNAAENSFEELFPYIGKAIQCVRRTFPMSKEQLARRMCLNEDLSIVVEWIGKIEDGQEFGFKRLKMICNALDRDIQTIFGVAKIIKKEKEGKPS